ncbi:NUDIX domain-containing protein [Boudabousia marimammalium]|uniref:ADP-ribose diphosphatase n=1 Tax=Boudabousia marimammalium TaxID=156892 RepID=A0A1Q5PRB3_9ACTO|nr:NUDIX hydrolase [Boudabousia marimammalium]OKL50076.1 ADP-ribose diphosphatase [Boudabousia marimammalium]
MNIPVLEASQLVDERIAKPVENTTDIWQGRFFSLHEDQVRLTEGSEPVSREYVKHPGAVAVVPLRVVDGREQVLMIKQYRHPVRVSLWEYPAGLLDVAGEDYLQAAQRELAEETDLHANQWDVLVDYFATPGGHTESLRIFLARDLEEIPEAEKTFERDEEEALFEWAWVDLDDAAAAVAAGKLHNPSAVTGTLVTYYSREKGWSTLRPAESRWLR